MAAPILVPPQIDEPESFSDRNYAKMDEFATTPRWNPWKAQRCSEQTDRVFLSATPLVSQSMIESDVGYSHQQDCNGYLEEAKLSTCDLAGE